MPHIETDGRNVWPWTLNHGHPYIQVLLYMMVKRLESAKLISVKIIETTCADDMLGHLKKEVNDKSQGQVISEY